MGDGVGWLAVPDWRTIGAARRVHENGGSVVQCKPFKDARRSVALHAPSLHFAETGLVKEGAHQRDAFGARRKCAVTGVADVANIWAEAGRQRESNVKAIWRQRSAGPIRPFHQNDSALRQVLETEFGELGRAGQPIEVGMSDAEARQFVDLHQSESRAGHLDGFVAGEMANERAGE